MRVSFDGTAGGSATPTAAPNAITLPFGQETGNRVILDGEQGFIVIGDPGPDAPGARIELDPVGGIRLRSDTDQLVGLIDQGGYTLRDNVTGGVVAELKSTGGGHSTLRLVDSDGTDDIEISTSGTGVFPNPKWRSATEADPGTTVLCPSLALFTSTPPDDYELYHAAYGIMGSSLAATMTPPAGCTERVDHAHNVGTSTLHVGVAERDPASGIAATFTNSSAVWLHAVGTHLVIRGGGATSPSYRSLVEADFGPTAATNVTATVAKPAGVVEGDVLVAFVSMHNAVGTVPVGWTTPEGWIFQGANYTIRGSGAALQCLAVGTWVKLATATEPADYTITIKFGAGTKRIHAAIIAVQNPDLISGGAGIRMSGHPIRRLLKFNELTAPNQTLCDFTNIPPGFNNLEFIYDGISDQNGDTTNRRIRMRYNGILTGYYCRHTEDGVDTGNANNTDRYILGEINGTASGTRAVGTASIYGYSRAIVGHIALGRGFFVATPTSTHTLTFDSQWNGGVAINRIVCAIEAGTVRFAIGSRAYLYGY